MATAIKTTTLVDALGVNTHLDSGGTYSDLTQVEQNLEYLGLPNVRDSAATSSDAQLWLEVAQATGVKFDDYIGETSPAGMSTELGYVSALAKEGILNYVEGGNEEDDAYPESLGNNQAITAQFQQQVYALGQSLGLPVINMSFGAGWTAANNWEGDYPTVGNLSAYTNYANAHTYPSVGQTPSYTMSLLNSDAKLAASSRPVITTEMGWETTQFSQTQIAQYVVDASLDAMQLGDAGLYFYALYDDGSGDWGLFNSDGTPRPAATALHDLTTLLADPGSANFTPGSYNYSLSGTQSGDNSLLMQKSDGSDWIALWNESGSTHTVTISLPGTASEVEVYDTVTGTSAIQSASNTNSISVSLGADPLLVEVIPSGVSTSSSSTTGSGSTTTTTSGTGSSTSTTTGTTTTGTSTTTTTSSSSTSGPDDLVVTVPASDTVTAGKATQISGISISDAWGVSNGGSFALNVYDKTGSFTMNGVTYQAGGGNAAGGMVTGSLSQINAALASIVYTAASAGSDTLTVDVWNPGGDEVTKTIAITATGASTTGSATTTTTTSSGSGTTTTSSGSGTTTTGSGTTTTATTGTGSNDLAVTVPGTEQVTAGKATAITGISVSDPWGVSNGGGFALNVYDNSGSFTLGGKTYQAGGGKAAGGMVSGSLATINQDLANLTYTPGTSSSDTLTVDVWNPAGVEVTKTIQINVTGSTTSTSTSTTTTTTTTGSTASTGTTTTTAAQVTVPTTESEYVATVSNETLSASGSNQTIFLGGTGETLTSTGGSETIQSYVGGNTINAGGGNNNIYFGGTGNVINAGTGNNTLHDSGTDSTIALTAGGNDTIYGYPLQNGDKIDLTGLLKSAGWNGQSSTIANYIGTSSANNNTMILFNKAGTGGASGTTVATLTGAGSNSLSVLLAHAIT